MELSYQKDSGPLDAIILPDGTKLCYTYSKTGNLKKEEDFSGNATESATTSGDVESQEKNTYDVMGRVTSMKRYKSNKKKMEKKKYSVKRGYLYGQYNYSNIEFRETNISDAGCGIVAAHNAMYTCGKKELFVKLVAEYDFNMKSSGRDGIKWSTVASSIRRHGFKSKSYRDQNDFEKKITSTKPGILEANYRTGGGHFAMIRKVGNKFHCYNLTGYSLSYTQKDDFDSVEDILRRITAHFEKGYIISK